VTTISTHILDTAQGRPAAGVPVTLERLAGGAWEAVGDGRTDADGRLRDFAPDLAAGRYRLRFDTGGEFFPEVTIVFEAEAGQHYHVPLLLSPFGYSTYRGS
jgi:5-hydroxyisourate hydrolase